MQSVIDFSGSSMFPLIPDGASLDVEIFKEPLSIQNIDVGQVVLLRDDSQWVVHRVVSRGPKKGTKGDWSMNWDEAQYVWGVVKGFNGCRSKLLKSSYMAKVSSRIDKNNRRFFRQIARLQLLLWVGLRKNRRLLC